MRVVVFTIALLFVVLPRTALAECRLALVLALDVSGSVNEVEYAQQLNGLAFALNSEDVRDAILAGGRASVDLAAFEWSSQNHQFVVQPWITLDSHAAIDAAVARIKAYRKQRAGLKTALSTALEFAGTLLSQKAHCWQRTIDVSGDGKNNIGPPVSHAYGRKSLAGVTVNALVIGTPTSSQAPGVEGSAKSDLRAYYESTVIRGPGAFAMVANGYADYARAMRLKLLRELAFPVLGAASR